MVDCLIARLFQVMRIPQMPPVHFPSFQGCPHRASWHLWVQRDAAEAQSPRLLHALQGKGGSGYTSWQDRLRANTEVRVCLWWTGHAGL